MTTLLASVLRLRPTEPTTFPRWSGVYTRAWLIRQMPESIQRIAVPDDGILPYTCSTLQFPIRPQDKLVPITPDDLFTLRITSLHNDLSEWMLNDWLPTLQNKHLQLHESLFQIEEVTHDPTQHSDANCITDTDLVVDKSLNHHLPRRQTLYFQSPTTFRRQKMFWSLPLPELVYGSLLRRWNHFHTLQLHPDTRTFSLECATVRHHRLNSVQMTFEGSEYPALTGTVGRCSYVVEKGDRYWRAMVNTLSQYAFFAGVGVRTGVGMGQVRVHDIQLLSQRTSS